MSDFFTETKPKAKKEYHCDASSYLINDINLEAELNKEELEIMKKAKENNYKIQIGDQYIKVEGYFDGEWQTYKAIPEVHKIWMTFNQEN